MISTKRRRNVAQKRNLGRLAFRRDEGMDMDIVGVLQNGSRVLFDGTGVAGYKNVTRL